MSKSGQFLRLAGFVSIFSLTVLLNIKSASATAVGSNVEMDIHVPTVIGMTITGNADSDTGCGVVNRYADSEGNSAGVAGNFDGTTGGANEVNNNTSCSKIAIAPGLFGSTASKVKVYTNSTGGYNLAVKATTNANLVSDTYSIPAGTLSGETGGQGLWSYKTDTSITNWTAMTTTDNVITNTSTITPAGDETNVTYGVSASSSQAAGLYKTTLVYTATTIDGDPTPAVPEFFTATYMQDMTPSVCASATTPTAAATTSDTTGAHDSDTNYVPETTLIDYRGTDGTGTSSSPATGSNIRSYTVRKLADGNCWMSENLKLTLSTSHSYEVATFSGGTTTWTPNQDTSSGEGAYNAAITINTKANVNGGNWYYPWYAATAGQGTQTENPTISQSICPKGWKLPNAESNSAPSFQSIVNTYSATTPDKIKATPLSYTAVGRYLSGSLYNSSYGYYWPASPYTSNSNYAYYLYFNTSSVYPQSSNSKNGGFSVRCVAIP